MNNPYHLLCHYCSHEINNHDEPGCAICGCTDYILPPHANLSTLTAEHIAREFHFTYEDTAPIYAYKTRAETRTHWDDLPTNNRELMIRTVKKLLDRGIIFPGTGVKAHND